MRIALKLCRWGICLYRLQGSNSRIGEGVGVCTSGFHRIVGNLIPKGVGSIPVTAVLRRVTKEEALKDPYHILMEYIFDSMSYLNYDYGDVYLHLVGRMRHIHCLGHLEYEKYKGYGGWKRTNPLGIFDGLQECWIRAAENRMRKYYEDWKSGEGESIVREYYTVVLEY